MFVYGPDLFYSMISSSLRVFSPFLPLSLLFNPSPKFTPPTVFAPSITPYPCRTRTVCIRSGMEYTYIYLPLTVYSFSQPREGTRE